jgi:hypothetical protein
LVDGSGLGRSVVGRKSEWPGWAEIRPTHSMRGDGSTLRILGPVELIGPAGRCGSARPRSAACSPCWPCTWVWRSARISWPRRRRELNRWQRQLATDADGWLGATAGVTEDGWSVVVMHWERPGGSPGPGSAAPPGGDGGRARRPAGGLHPDPVLHLGAGCPALRTRPAGGRDLPAHPPPMAGSRHRRRLGEGSPAFLVRRPSPAQGRQGARKRRRPQSVAVTVSRTGGCGCPRRRRRSRPVGRGSPWRTGRVGPARARAACRRSGTPWHR